MAVTERVHEFAESGGALDLEEDLIVVVRYFDVQVFARGAFLGLLLHIWGAVLGHFGLDLCCLWFRCRLIETE